MRTKNNSEDLCTSRFCPANTYTVAQPPKKIPTALKVAPKKVQPIKPAIKPHYDAPNTNIYAQEKMVPVDKNQLERNRLLREKLDAKRQLEYEMELYREELKYKQPVVQLVESTTPPEAIKMRLLVMMGKFRDANFDYKYLSQYFEASFKRIGLSEGDAAVLETFLIFDKIDLTDSAMCYATALKGIDKTPTTRYSRLGSVVEGLASILKDLQQ